MLNDGCYGISANRGELALTLLRAPLVPNETNNRGEHTFTYALYVFNTSLAQSDTVRQGYALNVPLALEARMASIIASNISKPSRLYSTTGSCWP